MSCVVAWTGAADRLFRYLMYDVLGEKNNGFGFEFGFGRMNGCVLLEVLVLVLVLIWIKSFPGCASGVWALFKLLGDFSFFFFSCC